MSFSLSYEIIYKNFYISNIKDIAGLGDMLNIKTYIILYNYGSSAKNNLRI